VLDIVHSWFPKPLYKDNANSKKNPQVNAGSLKFSILGFVVSGLNKAFSSQGDK